MLHVNLNKTLLSLYILDVILLREAEIIQPANTIDRNMGQTLKIMRNIWGKYS
jgi:hypothetical protein